MEVIIGIILLAAAGIALDVHATKKRRERLLQKYKDPALVDRLMKRSFWQGQSAEQLLDSLGKPLDVETHVMKTKRKEVWKYKKLGVNRYGLKITLENQVVVGWDQK